MADAYSSKSGAHIARLGEVGLIFKDDDEYICVMVSGDSDHAYVPAEEVINFLKEMNVKYQPTEPENKDQPPPDCRNCKSHTYDPHGGHYCNSPYVSYFGEFVKTKLARSSDKSIGLCGHAGIHFKAK